MAKLFTVNNCSECPNILKTAFGGTMCYFLRAYVEKQYIDKNCPLPDAPGNAQQQVQADSDSNSDNDAFEEAYLNRMGG